MHTRLLRSSGAAAALLTTISVGAVAAQEPFVWENQTELSFVATGGNASSSTLGLKSVLQGSADANSFKLEVGGIRGETAFRDVRANGTPGSFSVTETSLSELTAESYFARARYDRSFDAVYVFGGSGWARNTFAGIQNRYQLIAGLGKAWVDSETARFKTDIGATYTIQKDVSPVVGADEGFGGVRLSVDAMRQLSETTEFTSELIVDENIESTADVRADWTNALAISLSDRLAFKTSLQLMFDNKPSLQQVPLFTGGVESGTVLTPGDDLDTVLTLALVIKM